ncbi:MAG: type I methionyl aminopeptidase [Candidatus Pacebacteria bacterium]|nr:type I methionyl aminopeptidase [Candidatus Paceibacterota bacterium]
MITIKTAEQIALLREAGKIHARILDELEELVTPGMSTWELDQIAEKKIREAGALPAFLGYRPDRFTPKFPASTCISLNDTVVHGIPNREEIIKEGDIVSIDLGLNYKGLFTDAARTIAVGKVSPKVQELIADTYEALSRGIEAALPGNTTGDIGFAVESFNSGRYGNVKELAGHGVGIALHEEPFVPNFGKPGKGAVLKPGMVIAIEPMFTLGKSAVDFYDDGYTVKTSDGSLSAHVEHTVLITEDGHEILTK